MSKLRKFMNFIYLIIIGLLIALGIACYQNRSTIPENVLLKDGKYYVELNGNVPDLTKKSDTLFVVPKEYHPSFAPGLLAFEFRLPGVPYHVATGATPIDVISVYISKRRGRGRSEYLLDDSSKRNLEKLVDKNNKNYLVEIPGEYSAIFIAYKHYSDNIELQYSFSKELSNKFGVIDSAVIECLSKMQP